MVAAKVSMASASDHTTEVVHQVNHEVTLGVLVQAIGFSFRFSTM